LKFRLHNLNWLMLLIDLFISGYMFRTPNGRIQTVYNCSKRKLLFLFLHFLQIDILHFKNYFFHGQKNRPKKIDQDSFKSYRPVFGNVENTMAS
jgi:hypothetical protein